MGVQVHPPREPGPWSVCTPAHGYPWGSSGAPAQLSRATDSYIGGGGTWPGELALLVLSSSGHPCLSSALARPPPPLAGRAGPKRDEAIVAAAEEVRGPGQVRSLGGRLPLLTRAWGLGVAGVGCTQLEGHVPSLAPPPPRVPQNGCGLWVGMGSTTGQVETPGSPSTRAGDLGEGRFFSGPFRKGLPGSVSVFLPTPPSAPCPVQPPPSCIHPPMRGHKNARTTCVGVPAPACGHRCKISSRLYFPLPPPGACHRG